MPKSNDETVSRITRLTTPGKSAIAVALLGSGRLKEVLENHFSPGRKGKRFDFNATCADRNSFETPIFGRFTLAGNVDNVTFSEEVVLHLLDETTAEVHLHGGDAVFQSLERTLRDYGFRTVSWQEELCESKTADEELSLIQAEVLQLLPHAKTERVTKILLDQYHGALIRELAERKDRLRRIEENAKLGLRITRAFRIVLFGAVNAGKSSLVNAILGFERVIADPTPGTTRDSVETETVLDGWPVLLVDTAGMRHADGELERLGIEKTRTTIQDADLLLHVIDSCDGKTPEEETLFVNTVPILKVYTKADLLPEASETCYEKDALLVSAKTRFAMETLLERISQTLVPDPPRLLEGVPLNARQTAQYIPQEKHN